MKLVSIEDTPLLQHHNPVFDLQDNPKPKSTEMSTFWITSSSKVKPIKVKVGSTLMSQEKIEDVLNSIPEGPEKINEELAKISQIANFALQVSLANQAMLSTLCKDNSLELEEIPHFQFLKKRARDFNELSFQLSFPINKNMIMDLTPKEVVPCHISNSEVKPSTSKCRHQRNFSELPMTLSKDLEKLLAKGFLQPLDPKPILYPMPRRYNTNAHCRYHQGKVHTTDKCYNLRHDIQDLIEQQVITPPSSTNHLDFV